MKHIDLDLLAGVGKLIVILGGLYFYGWIAIGLSEADYCRQNIMAERTCKPVNFTNYLFR
jgi:hypothetical protein